MKIIKPLILASLVGILAYLVLTQRGKSFARFIGGSIMNISQTGIDLIAGREGFSEKPYNDPPGSQKWSIGYGHQILPGENLTYVTRDQALTLLAKDTAKAEYAVKRNITVVLTQAQHDALVSFVYNVGIGAFEKGSVPTKINAGNFSAAANSIRAYNKAGGVVNMALVARRESEAVTFA